MKRVLPTDSAERKNYPLFRGCHAYFPAALAGVARISKLGNDKHNPGEEMHHARGKSSDHADCIERHLHDAHEIIAAFKRGPEIVDMKALADEIDQLAWRALALSQELHEKYLGAPLAMGAKLPAATPGVAEQAMRVVGVDADGGVLKDCPVKECIRTSNHDGPHIAKL